jgi:hypothetical protein
MCLPRVTNINAREPISCRTCADVATCLEVTRATIERGLYAPGLRFGLSHRWVRW